MIKIKRTHKKGFTLVEALVSSSIMMVIMAVATTALNHFNYTSTISMMRSEMDMDLRKSIERLEREITPARNVMETKVVNGQLFTTSNSEISFQIPSYTIDNLPLYEHGSGEPQVDFVGIKMDVGTTYVYSMDPATKAVSSVPTKKLIFSIEPAPESRRKSIKQQSIFEYYIPLDGTGTYTTSGTPLKLFSYYGEDSKEIIDPLKFKEARTIKIVLQAQKYYGGTFMTVKRETEIRLRNSNY